VRVWQLAAMGYVLLLTEKAESELKQQPSPLKFSESLGGNHYFIILPLQQCCRIGASYIHRWCYELASASLWCDCRLVEVNAFGRNVDVAAE